jgi:ribosomal protein L14E/L6E/L27E
MAAIKAGTVCILKKGRRAGSKVTVTKVIDDMFVEVQDEKGKVRRSSIMHLEPVG